MRAGFKPSDPKQASQSQRLYKFCSDLYLKEEDGNIYHSLELFNICKLYTYSEVEPNNQITALRLAGVDNISFISWKDTLANWSKSEERNISKWTEVLKTHIDMFEKNQKKRIEKISAASKQEIQILKDKRKKIFLDNAAFGFRIVLSEDGCPATYAYFSFKLLELIDYSPEDFSAQCIRYGGIPNMFVFMPDGSNLQKFPSKSLEFFLMSMFDDTKSYHELSFKTKIIIPRTFEMQEVQLTNYIIPATWRKEVYLDFYTVIEPLKETVPFRYSEISPLSQNFGFDFTREKPILDSENLFKFLNKYYGRSYPENDSIYESKTCRIKLLKYEGDEEMKRDT